MPCTLGFLRRDGRRAAGFAVTFMFCFILNRAQETLCSSRCEASERITRQVFEWEADTVPLPK